MPKVGPYTFSIAATAAGPWLAAFTRVLAPADPFVTTTTADITPSMTQITSHQVAPFGSVGTLTPTCSTSDRVRAFNSPKRKKRVEVGSDRHSASDQDGLRTVASRADVT